ncbi:hypothetical protein ABZX75_17585 [Streptomyces sp. NPDC003038]|uniref:hypothetical protein n=1 Tax=unclassified Streptomyces TaxID=2593676 RepID=UPI0033A0C175
MKLPRVRCPICERPVAAGPVAGRLSKGRVWRHDPPDMRSRYNALISCDGSLEIIDLPYGQMEIPVDEPEPDTGDQAAEPALF